MQITPLVLRSTLVAGLGGFLFGFDTAVVAGCTAAIKKLFMLNELSLGFMVASALLGTISGAAMAAKPSEQLGRRESLYWIAFFFLVSAIGCALAWDLYSLVFFRFIGGLSIGGASVIAPMYLAEIAPPQWRGRIVGVFQLNIVVGILGAYLSNFMVGYLSDPALAWRFKFGMEAFPALFFLVALRTVPRSPRWLVKKGFMEEAHRTLAAVGEKQPETAISAIEKSFLSKQTDSVWRKDYRFPAFLVIVIATLNQLSGINGLLYYINDIFRMAGFSEFSADLQSVSVGLTNLIFTILAMTLIDRWGRRRLLQLGSIGMAFSLFGAAFIFETGTYQNLLVWILMAFIASFAFSHGAVVWVFISEIFPNSVRAQGQALGSTTHWIVCAAVSWTFPYFAALNPSLPFYFFGAMMLVQLLLVLTIFPETKGKALESLDRSHQTL